MSTVIAWIAVIGALVALGWAWRLSHALATATRRLDRYNRALFEAKDEIRQLQEQMQEEMAQLRVALRRRPGEDSSVFVPEMTVREVLMMHPQTEQVLASFHLGGCDHCAVEPDDTLAEACAQHGVEQETLLANLNQLVRGGGPTDGAALQPVKLPNVALEL